MDPKATALEVEGEPGGHGGALLLERGGVGGQGEVGIRGCGMRMN